MSYAEDSIMTMDDEMRRQIFAGWDVLTFTDNEEATIEIRLRYAQPYETKAPWRIPWAKEGF